jgi:hypothetical protein
MDMSTVDYEAAPIEGTPVNYNTSRVVTDASPPSLEIKINAGTHVE